MLFCRYWREFPGMVLEENGDGEEKAILDTILNRKANWIGQICCTTRGTNRETKSNGNNKIQLNEREEEMPPTEEPSTGQRKGGGMVW